VHHQRSNIIKNHIRSEAIPYNARCKTWPRYFSRYFSTWPRYFSTHDARPDPVIFSQDL